MSKSVRRWRAAAGLVLFASLSLLPPLPSATAHPYGPPLTAHLTLDDRDAHLTWTGAEDDWMALGERLGVFDEVDASTSGAERLAASPEVVGYLGERIRLRRGDADCVSRIEPAADLIADGVRLDFDCPQDPPADEKSVEVTIESMVDLNEAYRTVLTVEGSSDKHLFTAAEPTLDVPVTGGGPAVTAVTVGVGALGLGAAGVFVLRRRRTVP